MPLDVPRRSYNELRTIAADFLARYNPTGTIPVPVEDIIEFEFDLDIIPVPGLYKNYDIDAYVSRDLADIWVDLDMQESKPRRYRYGLAHELAHVLIHRDVIAQLKYTSLAEWKAIHTGMDDLARNAFEGQAHDLGCLILVPSARLRELFDEAQVKFSAQGLAKEQVFEHGRYTVEDNLARAFGVERFVITARMDRDRLWAE